MSAKHKAFIAGVALGLVLTYGYNSAMASRAV